jgi:pimeloyl-ACP methyl ester carboxylesterase
VILPDWRVHEGNGPHLLLVHGFLSSRSQWLLNLEALAGGCTPVTVELFGHHDSPSPADPSCYHPDYYLRAFEAIRQELGAARWFLLGYSMGAGLTLRYALDYPDRTLGHLFTNSTSGLADSSRQEELRQSSEASAARIRDGGQAAMARIPVHPRHGWRLPKPVREALVTDAENHDPTGIADTIGITIPAISQRDRLQENSRPACLIWGSKEKRFAEMADFARRNMPLLTIAELDAGHGMNMEDAAGFNQAVLNFLGQCAATAEPEG